MISEDDVQKLASLARLELDPNMKRVVTGQINSILEYVQRLDEVNTSNVTAMSHTHEAVNILREDEVIPVGAQPEPQPLGDPTIQKQPMLSSADLLSNAPDRSGTFIRVPLIVE
jgi:aspartyl-tRNA(Asn)/glutamyl-tRNA(Gln) amidotransferase subunit C